MHGARKRVDVVPLIKIKVDDIAHGGYQRPINENKAICMALEFSWDKFNLVYVNVRDDDHNVFWVFDGQTRLAALDLTDKRGIDKTHAPALIYYGLTREEEAKIYTALNVERKNLHPIYAWNARAMYDPIVQHANKLLALYGFKVVASGSATSISAVGKIETIYRDFGPETLARTLCVVQHAWQHQEKIDSVLLIGLGLVLGCYEVELDLNFVAKRLSRATVHHWTAMARGHSITNGGSQSVVMARIISTELSKTRGRSRGVELPPFDEVYAKFLTAKRSSSHLLAYEKKKRQLHSNRPKPGSWIRQSRPEVSS